MNALNTIVDRTASYNMMKSAEQNPTSWTGIAWWSKFYVTLGLLILVSVFFALFYFFGKKENFENQEEKKPVKKSHWLF